MAELPEDMEDLSNMLIGAISAVGDLLSAHRVESETAVAPGDLCFLMRMIEAQAVKCFEVKYGPRAPRASND